MSAVEEAPQLGWMPDPASANENDWLHTLAVTSAASQNRNLRSLSPPVQDQGSNGSCVWQVVAGLIYAAHAAQGIDDPEMLSRMRGWWLCRKERGLHDWNVGCWLRQAFRKLNAEGFCRERYMPHHRRVYDNQPSKASDRFSADQSAKHALKLGRKPVEYRRLLAPKGPERVAAFREALADGFQIGAGWDVTKLFTRGKLDPDEPYQPQPGDEKAGGHAMRIVGSVDGGFLVANSWGEDFGRDGHFIMAADWAAIGRDPWIVLSAPYYSDSV